MTKLKAIKPNDVADMGRVKMMMFGAPSTGKTWLALDFPNVYYIDTEGGANKPQYLDKLRKSNGVYLGTDQGSNCYSDVVSQVESLATEKHDYKTLVIDSISYLDMLEIAKEKKRLLESNEKDAYGASKKPAIACSRQLFLWLSRIDMNVILIAHEIGKYENGEQIDIIPDGWVKWEHMLELSIRTYKLGSDDFKATVKKSREAGFQPLTSFNLAFDIFVDKFGRERIGAEVKQIILATPEQLEKINSLLEVV